MNSEITAIRKMLHSQPELSGQEFKTADTIKSALEKYAPDEIWEGIGGTGILAFYQAKESQAKTVLFRCELDALPIQEVNNFEHKSVVQNISHKCGHDGHMSIMLQAAEMLAHHRFDKVNVVLLFQPAEENGEGAISVFNDERFQNLKLDFVFALHNLPGFPMKEILVKDATFTCAVNSIIIKLNGKTAHAGEPENGDNPALAIAELVQAFDQLIQADLSREDFTLLTPIHINMGTKDYGISAGYGEVHYTFRRNSNAKMAALEMQLEQIVNTIAKRYHLNAEIAWTQKFHANENDSQACDWVRKAGKNIGAKLKEREVPFKWGEDFGVFTEHYKGAMFGIGSGLATPALHNPDYDYPDEITETGAKMFFEIAKQINDA